MSLAPGRDLSHYRLVEQIGEGGMGVVWRATDTTLGRAVAIKVLPEAFAGDPERMARFEREARLLASLNHPHIASIYGVGSAEGVRFLAMELIEGDDLAVQLARGPMPVPEAAELARQIAEALEAAHEKGIIHRDLKPANVKLTADGQVKLLDFGLAKAFEDESVAASSTGMSRSPTLTSPMTAANVILGTAAYMSPEQARGKTVDRRADIWAFGCVLYECLGGRRAFPGETVSDTIAKILEREPDWTALPAGVPARLRELLRRCLEKDARKRQRDIGDVRIELEELLAAGVSASGTSLAAGPGDSGVRSRAGSATLAWSVAAVALALVLASALFPAPWRRSVRPVAARSIVTAPTGVELSSAPPDAAISADGKLIVFSATDSAGDSQLWLRPLESLQARLIVGSDGGGAESPQLPFWSPDGKSIGFFAEGKLKTIPIGGGTAQTLCDAPNARGGTWNRDGVILFAASSQGPLFRISSSGGTPVQVTRLDSTRHETAHRFPRFLPDGRRYTFVSLPGRDGMFDTWIGELGSQGRRPGVLAESGALFAPPGHMVFLRGQSLVAQAFDPGRMRPEGEPQRIGDAPANHNLLGGIPASASDNGTLAYPTSVPVLSHLAWFGRDGRPMGELPAPKADYIWIALNPDNRQVAFLRANSPTSNDIWIADASSGAMTRLTTDGNLKFSLFWSSDGERVAYAVQRGGKYDFYERAASGSEPEKSLFISNSGFKNLSQLSPDGAWLVFDDLAAGTQRDIWVLPLRGDRKPVPYLVTPFNELNASLSPDGHWMLYQSDESGRSELYVQSFPMPGRKFRISTDGGNFGSWRDDGAEIVYQSSKGYMSVPIQNRPEFQPGSPKLLVTQPRESVTFGITSDFKRFLFALATGDARRTSLTLLTNWPSLLNR